MCVGELLTNKINASVQPFASYLLGKLPKVKNTSRWLVDVDDVAAAHILVMENSQAKGRYIVSNAVVEDSDVCKIMLNLEPSLSIPTELDDHVDTRKVFSNEKIKALGLKFSPIENTISRFVKSMEVNNLLEELEE